MTAEQVMNTLFFVELSIIFAGLIFVFILLINYDKPLNSMWRRK